MINLLAAANYTPLHGLVGWIFGLIIIGLLYGTILVIIFPIRTNQ